MINMVASLMLSLGLLSGHHQITQGVGISAEGSIGWYQQGSGFFIDELGDIATAAHVINGGDVNKIDVRFHGKMVRAKLIASNTENDVAILHIQSSIPTDYFTLTDPVQYEEALVLGYPAAEYFGLYMHETMGEVVLDNPEPDTFSIFAKSCHGNSGGVVINTAGDAIGVLVYGFNDEEVENGLCSYHAGARFITHLRELAAGAKVMVHYHKIPSIATKAPNDLLTSIVDNSEVVFIQLPVVSK